jgi:molybdopterin molybdotransferase
MLNAADALKLIHERLQPLGVGTVALERALGSALAEAVVAGEDIPGFDNAGMDGYALHASDTASAPVTLKLVGEVAAGQEVTVQPKQG